MPTKTKKPRGETPHVNFRLGDDDRRILEAVAERIGGTQAGAIRYALRLAAREMGIDLEPAAKRK